MSAMPNAKDIAQYAVNYYINAKAYISSTQLQQILYLMWVEHYKRTGEYLFNDDFIAGYIGPKVMSVYYDFIAYGPNLIFRLVPVKIPWVASSVLDGYLAGYKGKKCMELAQPIRRKGGAWDKTFRGGDGRDEKIEFETIIELECKDRNTKPPLKGWGFFRGFFKGRF